ELATLSVEAFRIWDPNEINEQVLFSLAMMLFLCAVNCPATQITGVRVIFDAEGYSFKQVRRFVPRYIPLVSKALRNCLPVRFKSIHIINESIVLRYGWSVLKVFLSEKIRNRFYIHGDSKDELLKYIQKEILPVDQGGDCANPIDGDRIIKELDKFYDRFLSMLKF
ncbi:clavesin-2, partial [Nephila pilipes]